MGIIDDFAGWAGRLKRVYDIAQDSKNIELIETIGDLRAALSSWKIKFSEMEEECLELKAKIKELESKNAISEETVFRNGAYYLTNPQEGKPNGPFCPKCFEESKSLFSLVNVHPTFSFAGRYKCPKCDTYVQ